MEPFIVLQSMGLCTPNPLRNKLERFATDKILKANPGNTKGGSITVPLTSCFTGLD